MYSERFLPAEKFIFYNRIQVNLLILVLEMLHSLKVNSNMLEELCCSVIIIICSLSLIPTR